jgi:CAP-Gly domain-containing linker protein 1
VQDLQKENLVATQRIKIMESENELLLAETRQLRQVSQIFPATICKLTLPSQEVQILEENLDHSLTHDDHNIVGSPLPGLSDMQDLPRMLKEQKARFEVNVERLKKL